MPSSPKTIKALKASGHLQICFALAALIYLVVLIIIRLEFSTAIILNLICVAFAIINTVFTAVVTRKQLGHAGKFVRTPPLLPRALFATLLFFCLE
jgi:hypothetical protein